MNRGMFALALAASVIGCATVEEQAAKPVVREPSPSCRESKLPYKLGIAGFTYHKVRDVEKVAEAMQSFDCHYLCHKDFLLPYDADEAAIAAYKATLAKYGIETLATGPLYADNEETARKQFAFAKRFGLKVVVGVPFEKKTIDGKEQRVESDRMLDVIEKLVKEYDIRYAIHNHGPDIPYLFPTAEAVWKRIEKRDRRIGFCLDVGHQRRAGNDPAAAIRKYAARIYDVHLKNIKIDPKRNFAKEGPRGELDIPAILQALADIGYAGGVHVEYEKDFECNLVPLAESIGYYRGVMDCVRPKLVLEAAPAGANTLTAKEKAEGWELLFDGKTPPAATFVGAKGGCKAFPAKGWVVREPNVLTVLPVRGIQDGKWIDLPPEDAKLGGGGDIVTKKMYRDFHFKFDFRLTEAANSGIKYYYDEKQNGGSCEEYQIMDKEHPDQHHGHNGDHRVASLYDIIPANADEIVKGPGQWNHGEIIAKGNLIQHWLNGKKVVEYVRGGEAFRKGVANSKYAKWGKDKSGNPQPWGEVAEGRILLQDHSDSTVSFCNLKIREL